MYYSDNKNKLKYIKIMGIDWKINEKENFTVLEFKIEGDGILDPADLKEIKPPALKMHKGLILSGRGPVWLYAFLTHWAHPFAWVGIYDAHLSKAIVIERHVTNAPKLGDTIKIN